MAKLPLKKVSEPLTLVFHINELIGTCGERILSQLSHPQTAQVLAQDLADEECLPELCTCCVLLQYACAVVSRGAWCTSKAVLTQHDSAQCCC